MGLTTESTQTPNGPGDSQAVQAMNTCVAGFRLGCLDA